MRWIPVAVMAASVAAAQEQPAERDEARIGRLVRDLGHEDYTVRERAQEELIRIGLPALGQLEPAMQSPDPEVATRARTIVERIRRDAALAGLLKPATLVTLARNDVTLEEAAKAIGAQAKLQARASDTVRHLKVSLNVEKAELLRVLDSICRQHPRLTYRFEGTTGLVFEEGPFVDLPSAYSGPLKLKITRIQTWTDNDFSRRTSEVTFTFGIEAEPGVHPAVRDIVLEQALDEKGQTVGIERDPEPEGAGGSTARMSINGVTWRIVNGRPVRVGGDDGSGRTASLRADRALTSLSRLKAKVLFALPSGEKREVRFDRPAEGAVQTVGDLRVVIEEVADEYIEFAVETRDGGPAGADASRLVDSGSIVVTSGQKQYPARLAGAGEEDWQNWDPRDVDRLIRRIRRLQRRGGDGGRFLVAIPADARGPVDAVRFTIREVLVHGFEFEFRNLDVR